MNDVMISPHLYPWLNTPFMELTRQSVPHSLLLFGEKDLGKLQFGLELARFLLCEAPDAKPCGQCEACHWVAHGNHPDFFVIVPQNIKHLLPFETEDPVEGDDEKKLSKFIRIEQIRQVISRNELGSYRGGKRVVLIYPIEAMQQEAANCLLKTLEEPSENLYFILITHKLESILPTIRSRCSLFAIGKPEKELAKTWLKTQLPKTVDDAEILQRLSQQAGSPLRVLQNLDKNSLDELLFVNELVRFQHINISVPIEFLSQYSLLELLNCLFKWMVDINFVSFQLAPRYFPQYEPQMAVAVSKLNRQQFQQFMSSLKEDLRLATHPLFPKVQLDAILTRYKLLF